MKKNVKIAKELVKIAKSLVAMNKPFEGKINSVQDMKKLRSEIVLGSLYVSDYENSFGIPADAVQIFFDSFIEHCQEEYKELYGEYPKNFKEEKYLELEEDVEDMWNYACDIDA